MLVVDFTVWVDYFNGVENPQTDYLEKIADQAPILIGDLILAEVLQGFREDADFEKAATPLENTCRWKWSVQLWHCRAPATIVC